MRIISAFAAIALLSGCASTTVIDSSWDDAMVAEMSDLAQDHEARVTLTDGSDHHGPIRVTTDSVNVGRGTTVARGRVDEVSFVWRNHRRGAAKGALAGGALSGGLGLGVGLLYAAACDGSGAGCVEEDQEATAVIALTLGFAAGGALVGAIVGAAVGTGETTIYRLSRRGEVAIGASGLGVKWKLGS